MARTSAPKGNSHSSVPTQMGNAAKRPPTAAEKGPGNQRLNSGNVRGTKPVPKSPQPRSGKAKATASVPERVGKRRNDLEGHLNAFENAAVNSPSSQNPKRFKGMGLTDPRDLMGDDYVSEHGEQNEESSGDEKSSSTDNDHPSSMNKRSRLRKGSEINASVRTSETSIAAKTSSTGK